MSIAVRSTGPFPAEDSKIAAAFTFNPYVTAPACPNGTDAVVVFPQQEHFRRGSTKWTFFSRTGGISPHSAHDELISRPPARSSPHPEHSRGAATVSARSGITSGTSP